MVRFLHTADWQIGMTRRFMAPEAQARFAGSRIDAVRRVGRVAREQECDFVLVCGDVFEHAQLTPQTLRRTLEALRAVEVPVYLLPGNHDHLGAMSVWATPLMTEELPEHVHVLAEPGVHEVAPDVEVLAVPWHGKHPQEDLVAPVLAGLDAGAPGTVRILAAHGVVDVLDPERRHRAAIATEPLRAALESGLLHYVALGDRHSRTQVSDAAIWYSGAPEPTAWREEAPGDVLVVAVDTASHGTGATVSVTPHHVATWSFVTLERRVDSDADLEALDAELTALPEKDRTIAQLRLRGTLGLAQHARLEELLARHEDLLGALQRPAQHTDLVLAGDDDIAELGLGGFLASAVEDMRTMADDEGNASPDTGSFTPGLPDDGDSARDALRLLYRLARGGPS